MRATYLIGKHLLPCQAEEWGTIPSCLCGLCGAQDVPGFPMRDVIPSGFMDAEWLDMGADAVCVYCAACMGKDRDRVDWIKHHSFVATRDKLLKLKREDIWDYLITPLPPPFVLAVSYTHKKHLSFKARVAESDQYFPVQTDDGRVMVDLGRLSDVISVIQQWYSMQSDAKAAPTWFTKDEILYGCRNLPRIERYGISRFFEEDMVLRPWRGTAVLRLLVHALNKSGYGEVNP